MNILGLSAFYHDSAAALVVDGEVAAAAQEERFTRRKHDPSFPARAVEYCLHEAGLAAADLDYVAFYEKPLRKFDRLLETALAVAPAGFPFFVRALPVWLREKLFLPRQLRAGLPGYARPFVFPSHHESHAASAFFPSPFEQATVLTVDGVGEWATAGIGAGAGNRITLLRELHFPHSVGLLYSAFTQFCGFKVNSGEHKLMGLAPYGEPAYADLIREKLVRIFDDGSIRLDPSYFGFCGGLTMTTRKLDALLGGPPRPPEAPPTRREMDLAASIQAVTEEILLKMARYAFELTGMRRLCLAGGVALNCVANGRILREGPFEDLWIQPAAGDAGGALGAALFTWHQLLERPRTAGIDRMRGALLGPRAAEDDIRALLEREGAVFRHVADEVQLCDEVAALLDAGRVVGWVCGRMEFGPRALGARSILGDARNPGMQSLINRKIKFRESFRPFAPAVLEEHAARLFDIAERHRSPYMLLVARVREEHRLAAADPGGPGGLERVREPRSAIPAVTHLDYSARLQTVGGTGRFRRLLEAFHRRTGCPVLVNTSLNVRGEPIACTPEEALRCFRNTDMDALVLERFVLLKRGNAAADAAARAAHLRSFERD